MAALIRNAQRKRAKRLMSTAYSMDCIKTLAIEILTFLEIHKYPCKTHHFTSMSFTNNN